MMMNNKISRRSFFAASAAASLFAAGVTKADDTDVVIIGAGAAGIAAARQLKKLGKTYILIDARARAGGRLYTDTSLGQPFDGGGAYIHFAESNPWTAIAAENQVTTKGGLRLWSGSVAYRKGVALTPDELLNRQRAMQQVRDAYDEVEERHDMSMVRAMRQSDLLAKDASRIQAQMAAGEDPEWVSVSDWQRLEGGQNLLVRDGYGALAEKVAIGVEPNLGVKALAIDWSGSAIVVTTDKGPIRARKAIVTVPIGVLKAGSIKFTPALPTATLRALDGLRMGALSKLALRFEGDRFGFQPHQFLAEIGDPSQAMTFEAFPFNHDLVIAVFGGDYARTLAKQGEAAATDHVLERFLRIAGSDARKVFKGGKLVGWSEDELARGSYAVALPGQMNSRDALAKPVSDRIWFAGEATGGVYSMTAGGAYIAGREAATQVANRLSTGSFR
jgi:monoamine oxidase